MDVYDKCYACEAGYAICKNGEFMEAHEVVAQLQKGQIMIPQMVRIVPRESKPGHLVPTMGTKVMVGDQELTGVTKIVLTAEISDVWRADITCHVNMQPMDALAVIHYPKSKSWREKLIDWIVGDEKYEPPKGD